MNPTPLGSTSLRRSLAGVPVTSMTALGIAAFAQGVRLITENIAKTSPFPARRNSKGGYTVATDHPTYDLLKTSPNDYQTTYTFWATLVTHALVVGLGLAEIKRTGGRITGFHLLDPSFKPFARGDKVFFKSGSQEIESANVICVRSVSWTGLDALSTVDLANDLLGTRIAETKYQAALLANGAQPNGHLEFPGSINPQQRAEIRQGWNETHQGVYNAGQLGIVWGGGKFVQDSYSPADAQLVESQNFGVAEVSRLLNIPGWMLGAPDAIKPSSTEEGMALFVALTLSSWFRQIQNELDFKLLSRAERNDLFFWHDTRMLTRGDSRSQVDEADKLLKIGVWSPNEARLSLGMNPIADKRFDWHLIPVNNLQALETINPVDPAPTQPAVSQPNHSLPDAASEAQDRAIRAMRSVLADPITRLTRVETEGLRRASKKDRFDTAAEEFCTRQAAKLAEALAPSVQAANSLLNLSLDARAIAQEIADEGIAELRSLWTTLNPEELPAKLEPILQRWESRRAEEIINKYLNPLLGEFAGARLES